jgi:Bacterial Ig domain
VEEAPPPDPVYQELPPKRTIEDRLAEDDLVQARTQRVAAGSYGYVPYAYEEEHKSLLKDPRIWGSLLAATAIGVILAVVIVVAGGGGDGQVAGVTDEVTADVTIEAPAEGATVAAGQPFVVRAIVTHPDGIEQVDLQVNGSPIASDTPDGGGDGPPSNFTAELEWTPEDEGEYTLAVVGITPDGERFGEDNQRLVTAAYAAGSEAFVVALDPTNVREYPSTDERSQSFGQLQPGEERRILQKTSTGAGGWFLIEFPASPTGQGWVLEQLVDTRGDLNAVQSVEPPALPTPEPTPTETPEATPSATPESGEFDLEPAGYDEDEGYVEIKNNGPGDFRGYIVLFYLAADTTSGCQLNTQSGNYPIEGVQIAANQVVSVRFTTPQPDGLFCIGISVENDQDPENNAIGPYQKTG